MRRRRGTCASGSTWHRLTADADGLDAGDGIGQGVLVLGVTRLDDPYVDAQDLSAQANAASTAQTQSVLGQAQAAFNEPSSSGIASQLSNFWSQWDTVADNPTDQAARATLLASAGEVASTFNQTATSLTQVQAGASAGAMTDLSEVNREAAQVARLNADIIAAQAGGGTPRASPTSATRSSSSWPSDRRSPSRPDARPTAAWTSCSSAARHWSRASAPRW